MEDEHQKLFFAVVVGILIVNSVILYGVLSILSDHEMSRISSGAGINSTPKAATVPKPVALPTAPNVAVPAPTPDNSTKGMAKGFPWDLLSGSVSVVPTSSIREYPEIGPMPEPISERGGIRANTGAYQENPAFINTSPVGANLSGSIPASVIGEMNSLGHGFPDESLTQGQTLNTGVTLIYEDPKKAPSNYFIPEETPDNEAPLIPIYQLKDEDSSMVQPEILYDLTKPPMIIKCDISTSNITRVKHIGYKTRSTYHEEDIVTERPSEMAWFLISVRNRDTGELVDEAGFGRQYGLQPLPPITIRKAGRYSITFDGFFVKINSFEIDVKQ